MVDPVGGSFTGLHARVYLAGVPDYLVTTGGYDLENTFDTPYPSGDAMEHNVWAGRKLNSLSIERQMVDGTMLALLLNSTPYTGIVETIVTAGASLNTAGNLTLAGTAPLNAGNGILALTLAGATTTNVATAYITVLGFDLNGNPIQDVFAIPALSPSGTVINTSKAFATVQAIDNPAALGSGVTCGIASVAGVTTTGMTSAPGMMIVQMKLVHPVTTRSVIMTFNNCMIAKDPIDWKSGKTVSNKIDLVVQNPNTDITAQFA